MSEGRRPPLPVLRPQEVAELGTTLESMRDALDGRRDVEGLVRALTHETKAPLSAIRASAELLGEDMPEEDRRRFLESIRAETERLQRLVDRILELSALEARKSLGDVQPLDLAEVGREVAESARPLAAQKRLSLGVDFDGLPRSATPARGFPTTRATGSSRSSTRSRSPAKGGAPAWVCRSSARWRSSTGARPRSRTGRRVERGRPFACHSVRRRAERRRGPPGKAWTWPRSKAIV